MGPAAERLSATADGLQSPERRVVRRWPGPLRDAHGAEHQQPNKGRENTMRGPLTMFTSVLVAAAVAVPTGAAGADQPGRSNDPQTLLTWNSVAVSTLTTAKLPPPEQWLYTAYVQSAVYDAVVAIDRRAPQYRLHLHASHNASTDAAIAAAAHDILVAYFPAQAPTLDSAYGTSLALVPDGTAKADGIAVGQRAAAGIIALRVGRRAERPHHRATAP